MLCSFRGSRVCSWHLLARRVEVPQGSRVLADRIYSTFLGDAAVTIQATLQSLLWASPTKAPNNTTREEALSRNRFQARLGTAPWVGDFLVNPFSCSRKTATSSPRISSTRLFKIHRRHSPAPNQGCGVSGWSLWNPTRYAQ